MKKTIVVDFASVPSVLLLTEEDIDAASSLAYKEDAAHWLVSDNWDGPWDILHKEEYPKEHRYSIKINSNGIDHSQNLALVEMEPDYVYIRQEYVALGGFILLKISKKDHEIARKASLDGELTLFSKSWDGPWVLEESDAEFSIDYSNGGLQFDEVIY